MTNFMMKVTCLSTVLLFPLIVSSNEQENTLQRGRASTGRKQHARHLGMGMMGMMGKGKAYYTKPSKGKGSSKTSSGKGSGSKSKGMGTFSSKGFAPNPPIGVPIAAPSPIATPTAPVVTPLAVPVASPVATPLATPVAAPVATPTAPVAAPVAIRSCEPTVGDCVSTADALQTVLGTADADDVIAVCGSDTPITTTTGITIEQSGITLCCQGPEPCLFRSSGTDNNLDAFGASVRLQDLIFEDGAADVFFGGNVAIDGDGDHVVVNCEFRNGSASRLGGNLFVQTSGSITVEDSFFGGGDAGESGGGMYVLNARNLTVRGSTFSANEASGGGNGGGLFSVLQEVTDFGQAILLENNVFVSNTAQIGGGLFFTLLGINPTLVIRDCVFADNAANDAAGAGAIAESLDNLDAIITGTTGSGNTAAVCPDFLSFFDDSIAPVCLEASDDFP